MSGPPTFRALIQRFAQQRVLVLGDMVLDEYVVGRPDRISREAPVLILLHSDTFFRPGGATNTAHNLASLGAYASVFGVVGDDEMGRQLRDVIERSGIRTRGLLVDPNRPTSTKTRILAKGTQEVQQQIVRIDRLDDRGLSGSLRDRLTEELCRVLDEADALLISDYENGVISPEVIEACVPRARRNGLRVVVDSHGDLLRFKGVTASTPNQPEAEATLGTRLSTQAELEAGGRHLLEAMEAEGLLITRGSEGIALFERHRDTYVLPIVPDGDTRVVDPSGAGDTVAAVFTLALGAGADMRDAAYLSNVAGGEVVRKFGTATLTTDELWRATTRVGSTELE